MKLSQQIANEHDPPSFSLENDLKHGCFSFNADGKNILEFRPDGTVLHMGKVISSGDNIYPAIVSFLQGLCNKCNGHLGQGS